ncbi:putative cytosolic phospholipase A2 [Xylariales sp. PMI_506]|nr:putative cytosolic phospholipase A2 [Xylariales sp. PMI_506]
MDSDAFSIAYQQEILRGQDLLGESVSDEQQRGPGSQDNKATSSWADKVKGFVNDIKPTIQLAKSFVSLESRITQDIYDVNLFPEVAHVANIRRGPELCPEEQVWLAARKLHARDHFARYMGWDASAVHPDDVPTIGFGGSGGGYRAMLGFLGYAQAFQQAGLWDLVTYIAGVSGSCWTLGALYTFADGSTEKLIEHCKRRLSPHHPLAPDAVKKLLSTPRGDYQTLGPLIQKQRSGLHTVSMDLYSVFTTGYLFMQDDPMLQPGHSSTKEVAGYHQSWWKWSSAQKHIVNGAAPLPLLTAIRHERPWKDWADPEHPFHAEDPTAKEHEEASDAWFQWFEMTPFEIGCDELEAWCPTYGFGRPFEEGKSVLQLPEQSLALLLGLCTSAPAGPLSSYLATVQRNLPTGIIGDSINKISAGVAKIWGKQETSIFENHHPLHACNEHNFLYHYTPTTQGTPRPPGIENSPRIHLIDSGMDNNCPTMPLLNPARQVDIIINMDASSDVQKDSFPQRVDQIGSRRGLKFVKRRDIKAGDNPADPDPAPTVVDSYGHTVANPPASTVNQECTMVYLPLLPNERAVPGYDPSTAKFSGSYNLVWTPEQVDMIIKTSMANFVDGQDTIKEALFNAWQRKTWLRQQRAKSAANSTSQ